MAPINTKRDVICIISWKNLAAKILERTRWKASDEDINLLEYRLSILNENGISALNDRLINCKSKVWDTIAEHNFCYELIQHNLSNTKILYEPHIVEGRTLRRPIDFLIHKDGINFWIQMKKLSETERENRQYKAIERIKRLAEDIKVKKFFRCELSPDFEFSDVKPLIDYISTIATDSIEDKKYVFKSSDYIKAEVAFWEPSKTVLQHLTLGVSGDLDYVDVTGEVKAQIRMSLSNAAGAFDFDTDNRNINLIAMEIKNVCHIDIKEAVFGDEGKNGKNGFFNDSKFASKVAGIIVVKRQENLPITTYSKLLYINNRFEDMLKQISSIMHFDDHIFWRNVRR